MGGGGKTEMQQYGLKQYLLNTKADTRRVVVPPQKIEYNVQISWPFLQGSRFYRGFFS